MNTNNMTQSISKTDFIGILTVVDPEAVGRIHVYAAKVRSDLAESVEDACDKIGLVFTDDDVDDIVYDLKRGRNSWFDERYCFEIVEI